MCGISGFSWGDQEKVGKMNQLLKHRGPDGEGTFVTPDVSIGHTRLAILDLSERGKQPMTSADGSVAVSFNGEIYNFRELRQELEKKGHQFRSATDTEVILHAYDAWGIDCIKKLNGIFAIALWDAREKKLFLIRDHVGVKPLYYFWDDGKLIFASEIKAIFAHDVPRAVDRDALNIYFRMLYVPGTRTMFRKIFKVEPGTYLVYADGKLQTHRYWQPDLFKRIASRDEAIARIRTLMRDSVKRQLISERPVGVFLSGGIDSTAVLGLATDILGKGVKTFSVGFDVNPEKFNADYELAKKTAAHFGAEHHGLIVTGADAAKHLPDVIFHMDEPVANATQVATYLLSRFARKDIVVALGGDGGDELFGGYERYRLSYIISLYQRVPLVLRKHLLSRVLKQEKLAVPPGVDRYISFMAQKEKFVSRVLSIDFNDADTTRRVYEEQYFRDTTADAENDFMRADIRSWLTDESLLRSDKLSMAFALEQRVPILDHRLVELSLQIPSQWKLTTRNTKTIFKEAMSPYVSRHIRNQPKRGWFSPASIWLRNEVRPLMEEALAGESDVLNLPEIRRMYDDHREARAYNMNLLWAVLTFQLWRKKFL